MRRAAADRWLEAWGYTDSGEALHRPDAPPSAMHAYRTEIEELLDPRGIIRATAVFDVDGVPAVCFVEDDGRLAEDPAALNRIRETIWNQNLVSIVLLVREQEAVAVPVLDKKAEGDVLPFREARDTGPYSRRDLQSGDVFRRHADWFAPESRVDRDLLRNLYRIVQDLEGCGLAKVDAQYLMAQVLFVSYLEHREIVGERYRTKHGLGRLDDLVRAKDRRGISRLLLQLDRDFNGDFLKSAAKGPGMWSALPDRALERLAEFLARADLDSGQVSFWRYDFRYIPVELISGIYESFLSDEKRDVGAYYTPRHLANLVVDQAFASSTDILSEKIYDGACGSGILLTTAYRRMLAYAEAKARKPLRFEERRKLLVGHIFGSDLNASACRVTAFSLYLSMLEGLQPADIAELQENESVKLPPLGKTNIKGGAEGDFFSTENPLAASGRFSIFLSNPPWVEPKKSQVLSSDKWAKRNGIKIPRRQTAGAFMLRARESLAPHGRACLILPISIIAAPTSADFFHHWLDHYELDTLINFGDLRKLLFNTAKQPCVVALARPRLKDSVGRIPGSETFEYWVPKADISFAFSRLTLHGSDRHILQTQAVRRDSELLTSLFWGTARDVATIADLRLRGTLNTISGPKDAWAIRKGFHKKDASILDPVSSKPLREDRYLNAKSFEVDGPVLDQQLLQAFPKEIKTVTRLPAALLETFNGPKIVFTDGITSHRSVRAAFSKEKFSFSHSIGVITGPKKDEVLMRFAAAYLHSSLVQYVLLLTAYQVIFERERVTLKDVRQLPFIRPESHQNPARALEIVEAVAAKTRELERRDALLRQPYDPRELDDLIFEYFGLNSLQRARVREVSQMIAPNLQPGSIAGLDTVLQHRADQTQVDGYAKALAAEMKAIQAARGGKGDISIAISTNSTDTCGPVGIVKVEPAERFGAKGTKRAQAQADDQAVAALLQRLNREKMLPLEVHENLAIATDAVIRVDDAIYLIKPLVYRLWLRSEAYRDAERIVRSVLESGVAKEANG